MIGTRKSVVLVLGFYSKKGGTIVDQRKSGEQGNILTTRVATAQQKTNLESANHSNPTSFSNFADSFHSDHHKVDSNQSSPKIMPTFISKNQFENHIEDIDCELLKFDLP